MSDGRAEASGSLLCKDCGAVLQLQTYCGTPRCLEEKKQWVLPNERLGTGYEWYGALPWPPEPPGAGGWLGWNGLALVTYLQALGERQRAFEAEVRARLERLERAEAARETERLEESLR